MYYTIVFWKRDYCVVNGKCVLGERRTVFAKAYRDTRNEMAEMEKDILEWEGDDPVRNGTSSYREE